MPYRPVNAIAEAAELYARRGALLAVDLEAYLRNPLGYVIKRPDFLVLARPCRLDQPDRWLADHEPQEAWYVRLLVGGGPAAALREMPYLLPYCCWHRDFRGDGGRLHVLPTDRLIRKTQPPSIYGHHSSRSSAAA